MEVNKEIYGAESTWRKDTDGWVVNGSLVPLEYAFKRGEYDSFTGYNNNGRIPIGELADKSICYAAQAEGGPLAKQMAFYMDEVQGAYVIKRYDRDKETGWFFGHLTNSYQADYGAIIGAPIILQGLSDFWEDIDDQYWYPDGVMANYPKQPSARVMPIVEFHTKGVYLGITVRIWNTANGTVQNRTLDELRSGDWSNWRIIQAWAEPYVYRTSDTDFQPVTDNSSNTCSVCPGDTFQWTSHDAGTEGLEYITYAPYFKNSRIPLYGWINENVDTRYYRPLSMYRPLVRCYYNRNIEQNVGEMFIDTLTGTVVNTYDYTDWGAAVECYAPINATTLEELRKACAYYGLFFTEKDPSISALRANPDRWISNDMFCGVLDENGVGHGEYTRGTGNRENPVYNMGSSQNSGYQPGGGGDAPIPDTNPILPSGLEFTMAGRGTGIWALTPSEIDQVWTDIFGSGISPKMFGNNPMNAILSLKWTPFEWTPSGTDPYSPIVLGDLAVNELHEYPVINTVSTSEIHGAGSVKFNFDKNFFNARYMQARLFLPFYGYYALPTAQLLSSTLRIDFYYNVPDDLGVYIISYDDVVYDYVECCCDMEVPLTGSNAAAISASKRSEALSIATTVAGMAISTAVGWSGIKAVGSAIGDMAIAAYEGYNNFGGGIAGALSTMKSSAQILAEEGFWNTGSLAKGGMALGANAVGGRGIANTVYNAKVERAALKTNLPYHGSALQTTFLHMSMKPYVQIFRNAVMGNLEREGNGVDHTLGGTSEAQYKLKVGHACDVWDTIANMPENSLLQATGIADSTVVNMELAEVQELNGILQSGFYK